MSRPRCSIPCATRWPRRGRAGGGPALRRRTTGSGHDHGRPCRWRAVLLSGRGCRQCLLRGGSGHRGRRRRPWRQQVLRRRGLCCAVVSLVMRRRAGEAEAETETRTKSHCRSATSVSLEAASWGDWCCTRKKMRCDCSWFLASSAVKYVSAAASSSLWPAQRDELPTSSGWTAPG
jgi:hypothetical protein